VSVEALPQPTEGKVLRRESGSGLGRTFRGEERGKRWSLVSSTTAGGIPGGRLGSQEEWSVGGSVAGKSVAGARVNGKY
jgi:hypothetical protein